MSIQVPGGELGGSGVRLAASQVIERSSQGVSVGGHRPLRRPPEYGHAEGTGMTCAGRVEAVRIVTRRPAGASSRAEDLVLAVPPLWGPHS